MEGFLALGDPESAAEAEVLCSGWMWNVGRGDEAHAATQRALALLAGREPSREQAAALIERSRLLMLAGRRLEATEAGVEGLELAERFGDERLQARALVTLGAARNSEEDFRRGIAIAERCNSFLEYMRGQNNLAENFIQTGDLAQVEEIYAAVEARIRRVAWLAGLAWLDAQWLSIAYFAGDWARAETLLARYEHHVEQNPGHVLAFMAPWLRAWLAEARGDLAVAEASWARALELARAVKDAQAVGPMVSGQARFLLGQGRRDQAVELVDEVLTYRDEQGRAQYFPWLIDLAWLLHDLGRGDEMPEARNPGVWADAGAALAAGDLEAAADRFEASGFRTDEAYTRLRLGEQLAREGRGAEAAIQRDRALAFYREVGATAYVRRGEALLAETA